MNGWMDEWMDGWMDEWMMEVVELKGGIEWESNVWVSHEGMGWWESELRGSD